MPVDTTVDLSSIFDSAAKQLVDHTTGAIASMSAKAGNLTLCEEWRKAADPECKDAFDFAAQFETLKKHQVKEFYIEWEQYLKIRHIPEAMCVAYNKAFDTVPAFDVLRTKVAEVESLTPAVCSCTMVQAGITELEDGERRMDILAQAYQQLVYEDKLVVPDSIAAVYKKCMVEPSA